MSNLLADKTSVPNNQKWSEGSFRKFWIGHQNLGLDPPIPIAIGRDYPDRYRDKQHMGFTNKKGCHFWQPLPLNKP